MNDDASAPSALPAAAVSSLDGPVFSVIVATRDRPVLFAHALRSVLDQTAASLEVIVVDDGSGVECRARYDEIEAGLVAAGGLVPRFVHLERLASGHGQSGSLNAGARLASGRYLCFLDDDDAWVDMGHLARAGAIVAAVPGTELMLFDQAAFRGDERVGAAVWLEDLGQRLKSQGGVAVAVVGAGAYAVTPDVLLTAAGFCHVNTTIIGVDLFRRIGGFDETLFYECDRDFYLRAVDAARGIAYCPETVSRHNVPEPALGASMSTRMRPLQKHLQQFALLNRAAGSARHASIRAYARRHRGYALSKSVAASRTPREAMLVGAAVLRGVWQRALGVALGVVRGSRAGPAG